MGGTAAPNLVKNLAGAVLGRICQNWPDAGPAGAEMRYIPTTNTVYYAMLQRCHPMLTSNILPSNNNLVQVTSSYQTECHFYSFFPQNYDKHSLKTEYSVENGCLLSTNRDVYESIFRQFIRTVNTLHASTKSNL